MLPLFFSFLNEYFSFLLTWDSVGAKNSKSYPSYKSQPKVFKLFLIFSSQWSSHKSVGIFENQNFNEFFFVSLASDPMGAKISNRYSYKSQPKGFKLFKLQLKVFRLLLIFFPVGTSQNYVWDFSRGYSMGLMASRSYCFPTKLFLKISCDIPDKTYLWEFWNFKFNVFLKDWNLTWWSMETWNIANILEMASLITKRNEIWG